MANFQFFAEPWWVNLLALVPFAAFAIFRKKGLGIRWRTLLVCFVFGVAFGLVEACVVIYLRWALGVAGADVGPLQTVARFGASLFSLEFFREAATIVMLASVASLAAKAARERWAIFFWTFATWDVFYYIFLWLIIRWPSSLTTVDVLFLIPTPWYAQVWFPLLVDVLTMVAVVAAKSTMSKSTPV